MKIYTPRQLRHAIMITIVLTATAMLVLLDPSCQRAWRNAQRETRAAVLR